MNGKAIAKTNPVSHELSREDSFRRDLKLFMDEYKEGRRNNYIFTSERTNDRRLLVSGANFSGAVYPLSFDQFTNHAMAGAQDRRLSDPIDQITLNIGAFITPNSQWIADQIILGGGLPSTSDIFVDLYFTIAVVDVAAFGNSTFEPLMSVNMGQLRWLNGQNNFDYTPYFRTLNLGDTVELRDRLNNGEKDFTSNSDKLSEADYQINFVRGRKFFLIAVSADATGQSSGNTTLLNNAFFVNLSYAFGFYGVVASRI